MDIVHTLARGATAPIRLGLSAGGIGLSAMRAVVEEVRRALGGESSRGDGWQRPRPPRVQSPGPAVRARRESASREPAGPGRAASEPPSRAPAAGEATASATPPAPSAPIADRVAEGRVAAGPTVPTVPPRGAKQVDDEAVQVAESAERGAEEGAGAEVHVDPPWDGYDAMTAADIRDRLVAADAAQATAVALYEAAGRGRITVVTAAERRLGALTS